MEKIEFNHGITNVRKAFRLLYEYQLCVQNIVTYVKSRYGFDKIAGVRRFCDTIYRTQKYNGVYDASLEVSGIWAWDYFYSYEFEYFLGKREVQEDKLSLVREVAMSIIQVSDTGFYLKEDDSVYRTDVDKFEDVEKSKSILIFACDVVQRNSDVFEKIPQFLDDKIKILSCSEDDSIWRQNSDNPESGFFAKRYNIEDLSNQEFTEEKLKDFANALYERTKVCLISEKN